MSDLHAIDGVTYTPLRVIADERGAVLHFLRADSPEFTGFGEVYFSEVRPSVIKGWRKHRRQTQRYVVPVGRMRVVLYDDRDTSPTRGAHAVWRLGRPDNYGLLIMPPGIWYAFAAEGDSSAVIANCTDMPHHPGESESRALDESDPQLGKCLRLLDA